MQQASLSSPACSHAGISQLCIAAAAAGRTVTTSEVQDVLAGRQTLRDIRNAWFIQSAYVVSGGAAKQPAWRCVLPCERQHVLGSPCAVGVPVGEAA